jgi:hypothetical protein
MRDRDNLTANLELAGPDWRLQADITAPARPTRWRTLLPVIEESCSIHPDRPAACREDLVTSPAESGAHPTQETVRCVPLPLKVSAALRHCATDGATAGRPSGWVPLILAPEWAAAHPEEDREQTSAQMGGGLDRSHDGKENLSWLARILGETSQAVCLFGPVV